MAHEKNNKVEEMTHENLINLEKMVMGKKLEILSVHHFNYIPTNVKFCQHRESNAQKELPFKKTSSCYLNRRNIALKKILKAIFLVALPFQIYLFVTGFYF